jgi:RNA polymerase sigma factor (sigma-70 family)
MATEREPQLDDWNLLAAFAADRRAHEPFARLSARYADMVFATALRRTRRHDLAEDVTQAVFIVLARRAGELKRQGSLGAWLHRTALFASSEALRAEQRRRKHERVAAEEMSLATRDTRGDDDAEEKSAAVENALMKLRERDRQVLTLRYLEGKSVSDTAAVLGLSVEAARKRLTRALAMLRQRLARQGIAMSLLATGSAVAALSRSADAAPAAVASTAVAGGNNGSAFTLAHDVLRAMRLLVLKQAAAVAAAVILVIASTATGVAVHRALTSAAATRTSEFANDYNLADGQVLKLIPPPYPLQRPVGFQGRAIGPTGALYLRFDGRPTIAGASNWDWMVTSIVTACRLGNAVGGPASVDLPDELMYESIPGDWVIRDGTTLADRFNALTPIFQQALARPVHFEPRPATGTAAAAAVILRGKFELHPLDPTDRRVWLYTTLTNNKPVQHCSSNGPMLEFLVFLGRHIRREVVDESEHPPAQLSWACDQSIPRADFSDPATVKLVLDNLSAQTGWRFEESDYLARWALVDEGPPFTVSARVAGSAGAGITCRGTVLRSEFASGSIMLWDTASGHMLLLDPAKRTAATMTTSIRPGKPYLWFRYLDGPNGGGRVINGRHCIARHATDPPFPTPARPNAPGEVTGWIPDESRWPIEIEERRADGSVTVLSDIRFNMPMDAALFAMTPPEGYTIVPVPEKVPEIWGDQP